MSFLKTVRLLLGQGTQAHQPAQGQGPALEPEMAKLTDDELKAKTTEFKERLTKGETSMTCCPRRSPYAVRLTGACLA